MKTVALMSQKGGSGKSTIAVHLAVAAWQARRRITVIDCDPQATVGAWYRARENVNPPVAVVAVSELEKTISAAEDADFELVLIDSAPHVGPDAVRIARLANLAIIPVQPSPIDVGALPATVDITRAANCHTVIVLSRCPSRSLDIDITRQAIQQMQLELAPVLIGDRPCFAVHWHQAWPLPKASPRAQPPTKSKNFIDG